jgi:hypothetical protein
VHIFIGGRGTGGWEGTKIDASRTRKTGHDFSHLTNVREREEKLQEGLRVWASDDGVCVLVILLVLTEV